MEVVYILISFLEIIITCILVFHLVKLDLKVKDCSILVEKFLPKIEKGLEITSKTLSITSKISIGYKKLKDFDKYLSKILKLKGVITIINLIQGKKSKNKFNPLALIRKYLFYI